MGWKVLKGDLSYGLRLIWIGYAICSIVSIELAFCLQENAIKIKIKTGNHIEAVRLEASISFSICNKNFGEKKNGYHYKMRDNHLKEPCYCVGLNFVSKLKFRSWPFDGNAKAIDLRSIRHSRCPNWKQIETPCRAHMHWMASWFWCGFAVEKGDYAKQEADTGWILFVLKTVYRNRFWFGYWQTTDAFECTARRIDLTY